MSTLPADLQDADVAVIGGGAGGLNAALVLARARRRVVLFDDGHPRNAGVPHSFGFLGHDGIAGAALLAAGRAEISGYGARILDERVLALEARGEGFAVQTATRTLTVRAVVLATGFVDELPPIEGLAAIWGTEAADCPYCHGWEVRDRALAVAGRPRKLARTAALLTIWSKDVMLFSSAASEYDAAQRARLAAAGVRIVEKDVRAVVVENGKLRAVVLSDGERVAREAIFVGTKKVASAQLVAGLCELDESGFVIADQTGATSREGIWAVGNVTDAVAKLVHAAAAGSRTATKVNEYLLECDLRARTSPI